MDNQNILQKPITQLSNIIVPSNIGVENVPISINHMQPPMCMGVVIDIPFICQLLFGLFILYLLFNSVSPCGGNKNNYEFMDNPTDEYLLEQNLFAGLSENDKEMYLNLSKKEKMEYLYNNENN